MVSSMFCICCQVFGFKFVLSYASVLCHYIFPLARALSYLQVFSVGLEQILDRDTTQTFSYNVINLPSASHEAINHMIQSSDTLHHTMHILYCATLRGRIKEATRTLRKQDPALPENHALNRCEVCFKQV